ncbi:hypothetical protein Fmac_015329 [Flemingia macrophylla]|uniref:Uncharacterized protein n=1 Tax=Flemingia macrophylla TaxID=520843 RepID=A0ABD1MEA7_9FABA
MTTTLVSVLLRSNLEWMSIPRLMLQTPIADDHGSRDKALDREVGSQLLAEGKLDALVNLVTQLAANQKSASVSKVWDIHSSNDNHTSVCPCSQQSGVDEHSEAYAANTYSRPPHKQRKTRHSDREDGYQLLALEGKQDALVNLVTQLAASQKPASVARFCGIRSSIDHHTSVCPSSQQSGVDEHPEAYAANTYRVHDVATDTSAEAIKLEGKLDTLVNLQSGVDEHHGAYAANTYSRPPQHARNDVILIRGVHDVATKHLLEARKLEGKLDALVKLLTQLAASHKPASVARFCGIRSSIDHHTSVCPSSQQSGQLSARNDVIVIRGVHDVATDTSAEARKLEGKLDALVNLVTQLAANQKPASVARVCGIHSSKDHHTSVCPSSQQSRFSGRNDAIIIRGVHDMSTDISAEARKLEGKLDALVNLVTQLAASQKPASFARFCGIRSSIDHHTSVCPSSQQSGVEEHHEAYAANTYRRPPQQGVHDVSTDTSTDARKLEVKLDALVNLVTQLAANQKSASVARVCNIRSSNDNHTSFSVRNDAIVVRGVDDVATNTSAEARKLEGKLDALVNLQPGVYEHPEAYAANIYNRPPQQGVHDVATDTSAEARKLEGNLDALVSVVTPLAANQKLAFVARVCGIRSSNDHHTNVCPSSQQSGLDALVSLVTQLAVNQKPASVARVCGIRSSNDHHTSVYPSSQQSGVDEHPEAYAANTYSRRPQQERQYTSVEARKLEGKLDAIVNLMSQLTANQKPTFFARVCGIRSSNDNHTSVCPSSQQSRVYEHPKA